ncbi:MAG TPA: amino acid adenylation domain-containing protein [Thermoanaerobaculia bacterium]
MDRADLPATSAQAPGSASRLSPAARALLEERLKRRSGRPASRGIPRRTEPGLAPLSFAQERLWFLARLTPESPAYNIARAFVLQGPLEPAALEQSVREIVRRHEPLRTTFVASGPALAQRIDPVPALLLPFIDLGGLPAGVREAEAERLRHAEARRPFDLERGPLLRLALLHLGAEEHELFLTLHHIAADGWSVDVLFRELSELYALFSCGRPALLAELPVQYADFAAWQRERLQGELLERLLAYWRRRLAGVPPVLEIPSDRPRPAVRAWTGDLRTFDLAAPAEVLRQAAGARGASPFMVLLAAFFALLHRTAGRADLVVGSPVAGRDRSEVEGLIGLFVNTLVLRADLAGDPTFEEVLRRTREATLGAYDHQEMPFDKLVETLAPERDLSSTPLFQVLFALENIGRTPFRLPGLDVAPREVWSGTVKFDLSFTVVETGEGFAAALVYDREIFDAATMARLAGHYEALLAGAAAGPHRRLSDLPLLTAAERQQLLCEWNETWSGDRGGATIQELFAEQAQSRPGAAAVVCEGECLSYLELNERANRLAHHLRSLGVGPEVAVGVCLNRSLAAVVAILGIVKAGGAYVPLDPAYPRERLAFMLEDAAAPVLVTASAHLGALPQVGAGVEVVVLDRDRERIEARSAAELESGAGPDHLAYVIYTSGSTGRPKGVMVTHANVTRLFAATRQRFGFDAGDVWTLFHSLAFDFSVWEMWGALLHGGRLVVVPYLVSRSPEDFLRLLIAEEVTVLNQTPSAFRQLVQADHESGGSSLLSLRQVIFGGEALDPQSLAAWYERHPDRPRLVNMYGITETTVHVTFRPLGHEDAASSRSPIGRAIPDLSVHLLGPGGELVPAGVPGELCVGGAGLARGYLGRPDLTAQRFVPAPGDGGGPGARLYRSGDLARRLPDGELEYLGRIDHQVKIRGFRIELGEIEAALSAHPGVREAVVVAREDGPAGKRLVAYVVPEGSALPAELRSWLRERLPDYMTPSSLVALESLPLTPSGKVDRGALPAPERRGGDPRRMAPRNLVEELLAGIWAEALRIAPPGVDESFFDLGGHSLLATRVMSRIREVCDVELTLRALFEKPTVAELAEQVEAARRRDPAPRTAPIRPAELPPGLPAPLSFAQERLWFLARLEPESPFYNIPAALRLRGRLDVPALARSLAEIRRRHSVLRAVFAASTAGPAQRITPLSPAALPVADLSGLGAGTRRAEAARLAAEEARRPFDLESRPPLRAALLALSGDEHLLLLTLHHVVADGWSLGVLTRELSALYAAFLQGGAPPLPDPPIQYTDFARWQREHLRGEVLEEQLAYWRQRLAGAPVLLELPTDRPRPPVMRFRGGRVPVALGTELSGALTALGRRHGATPFMALTAGFAALLSRGSGLSDLPVGSVVAGRTRPECEELIGLFVNTLVLRADLAGDPGFGEILARVRRVTLEALDHQDVPFEKLVQELQPERSLAHSPLFQVMVMLVEAAWQPFELPGLTLAFELPESGTVKFDLNLALAHEDGRLAGALAYNSDLFDATTAARMAGHLETLLQGVLENPGRPLSELPLLTAAERHQALYEWNDTGEGRTAGLCLHDLFLAQAKRDPQAAALVFAGRTVSYGELARRAGRLARRLRSLGVRPGALVAVHLERGPEMVVALLGILQAGGAYVPLSASFPEERIRFILATMEIAHLITEEPPAGRITPPAAAHRVLLPLPEGEDEEPGPPPVSAGPDDLAYIIFTSGSTGTPKGVMVRHQPAVDLVAWVNRMFGIGPSDRVLFVTSPAFDLSVYDVFGLLAAGGSIRIASAEEVRDPARLARILAEEPVTFWDSAPAALQQAAPFLPAAPLPSARLRLAFLSGDWVPVGLPGRVRQAFPQTQVVSLGGATEATVWSNYHLVREVPPHWTSIPYGRPIANARYHVLDPGLGLCPAGVPGDLYIGGGCLSAGYANDPALTAGKYLPDPFSGEPGARLYRTGDRARHWADGTLEFLGRSDTQVKVRGFRIELGEIEAALTAHPAVREAVVLVREDKAGDQRLVACVIPEEGEPALTLAELRRFLRARLPDYMLPSELALRDAWPVTPTGKLDRRALLQRPPSQAGRETARAAGEPPRTGIERTIAAIWSAVIGREEIDAHENFFDLGGHSLLMIEVQTRLREALGREVAIVDLFRYPTVAALAEFLEGTGAAPRPAAAPSPRPATSSAIAIVGMAGRFPGASDLEELWRNLCDGVESITFFTDEELAAAGVDPALLADPAYVRARGVLAGADLFDAAFFDCPPREAEILDPQQRVFLECAWEALETAGYVPETCRGRVGVYAGLGDNTYAQGLHADPALVRSVGLYQLAIANRPDYLPTRVSYKLDLKGPSVNVQTACSTSLTAVHLACRALLGGDCEMALAGGVAIRFPQVAGYRYEEGSIASPDGHVRAFDAGARGTVAGNGAGVVLLKRLDDALADGDPIRAVILGSAINNDGSSKVGFTAPSVEGQAEVIRQAHRAAGVDPETIRYIEAHGTGTAVGDPIEVAGLTQAFRDATAKRGFCALGTIKTNLGHLDAAAGVAGLLKAALCLERRSLPPSLHFTAPNPRIGFDDSPFFVNARLAEWPAPERDSVPRRACVSSFGIGGTNAHAVLEEAPAPLPGGPSRPAQLLLLSARTATALDAATARLADHLESHPEIDLADAAYTLHVGRRAFRHRRMLVCRSREEAVRLLRDPDPVRVRAHEHTSGPGPVAFLFPGQGAQRAAMGAGLYAAEPAFREALDHACEILVPELGLDLRDLLTAAESSAETDRRLADTALAQPALFAVEHALARLLMSWGIRPQAMLGHSLGEYVAACLAGVFTLEEGLRLVAARGRLMAELPPGRMLSVDLAEEEARALLADFPDLSLAAVNAPAACTLSGPPEAVERLRERLGSQGVPHRLLRTSHAFHSPMMEPIAGRFAAEVRRVDLRPPEIPFLSNVSGAWITAAEATDPDYWVRHLLRTVRFSEGVAALLAGPDRILLEVGPGRALTALARQQPGGMGRTMAAALGEMKSESAEPALLLAALGRLWLAGAEVDWSGFYARERRRRVPLPTYPFERRRYWLGSGVAPAPAEPAPALPSTPAATGRTALGNAVEQGVAAVFEELLGVSGVGPDHDFFDLGGSSLMAVQLAARLRQTLGAELAASTLLEASTVAALAEKIASSANGESRPEDRPRPSCLVRLRTGGDRRPLFLVHQVGGHVYSFRALARALSPGRPLYGLRSRGLEEGEEPLTRIEEMADLYIELLREAQPKGPYLVGGASMGGLVALEMAHRLRAAGEEVPLITLMDTPCREVLSGPPADEAILAQVLPAPRLSAEEVRGLAPEEQLARALEKGRSEGTLPAGFDAAEAGRLLRVLRANIAALFAYELRAWDGPVLFFRARERRDGDAQRPEQPWIDLAGGGAEIHVVPGNHATMHDPPHVQAMAARLDRRLQGL